ncbi:olfactory receptor 1019-like [Microcaecilia unicolor]|uniref:Olfactory receptor n=1 Tax=Microcaecilia unicolor TaxID=1415580 RepID=A0A6P7WSL3_9AMPH|nr:olfactory receptor 1019-like [Microcaecilia unicolor]
MAVFTTAVGLFLVALIHYTPYQTQRGCEGAATVDLNIFSSSTDSRSQMMALTNSIEWKNRTSVTEFLFAGLTDDSSLQILLFIFFLHVYIITLLGNIGIILLIRAAPRLHTPMYFFLSHLSFIDVCYSSTITPNSLSNLLKDQKIISINGCATQLCVFTFCGSAESLLLGVMAYDRYVAVCNPLQYILIINKTLCIQLVTSAYIVSLCNALIHTVCTFHLSFCGSNVINHFYCDVPPLLELSCSDTSVNELILIVVVGFTAILSLLTILISYTYILINILRIDSTKGRLKTFSTCSSHFTAVAILYGTVIFMYLRPNSSYSNHDKVVSVFYTVVIPMLNPLIYSLRNQEVKGALRKELSIKIHLAS